MITHLKTIKLMIQPLNMDPSRLFHCIESVITLCARAPERVILNLPSNGVGYIGVNCLCHGVTNLLNVKKKQVS